jgi:hypothetical protein
MFPRKPLFAVAAFSLAAFALPAQQVTDAERIEWFQHIDLGTVRFSNVGAYMANQTSGRVRP